MIVHKSLFIVGRLGARRRSSPTTRLGACSCTCPARGAQALRCYKPPHGGKTTRGRAFVVGIGHPRRELSPGRRYRACRGATYEVVARYTSTCSKGEESEAFFTSHPRTSRQIYDAEKCAVDLGIRQVNLRNLVGERVGKCNLRPARKWGLIQAGVYTYFRIDSRAHARARTMSSLGERRRMDLKSRRVECRNWFYIHLDRAHRQTRAREWKNCLGKQKLRAIESVTVSNFNFAGRPAGPYKPRSRVFGCSIARWNQPAGRISMLSPELRRAALNPDRAAKVGWKYRGSVTNAASNRPATRINVLARFKINHGQAKVSVGGTFANGTS